MVASKQLGLEMETEEERRARQENDAATKQLRLTVEMEEKRKVRLEKMATAHSLTVTENAFSVFFLVLSTCVWFCPSDPSK